MIQESLNKENFGNGDEEITPDQAKLDGKERPLTVVTEVKQKNNMIHLTPKDAAALKLALARDLNKKSNQ